jgi:hypothetical protein
MSIFREMESNLDVAWSDELRRTAYELVLIDTIWDGLLGREASAKTAQIPGAVEPKS